MSTCLYGRKLSRNTKYLVRRAGVNVHLLNPDLEIVQTLLAVGHHFASTRLLGRSLHASIPARLDSKPVNQHRGFWTTPVFGVVVSTVPL